MDLRKRPLLAGAAALFLAGIANRVIGTVYRVLLVRTAGEEVIGILQMTWPVYRVAWTLATAGMFVAIARLTADATGSRDYRAARKYGQVGLVLTCVTAALAALFLFSTRYLFADHFLTDPRTVVTLAIFPLLLVPAALSSSLRGILQGQERLAPVAASNFLEAVSRVPIVLLLVAWLLPLGPAYAAGGIAAGLVVGEVVSVLFLAWIVRAGWRKSLQRTGAPRPKRRRWFKSLWDRVREAPRGAPKALPVAGALTAVAVPVLCSGLINGILGMFNVALIPRQLIAAGMDASEATIMYGRLFGMALPILYMPMVAIYPVVQAAIPGVARRLAAGKMDAVRRLLLQAFAVASVVSIGAAWALWQFGEELGTLLYGIEGLGTLVTPLAIAAPFTYLGHVAAGILYGLGRTGVTMANTVVGNMVRLGLIYTLVGDPAWGIVGALWAVVADAAVTAVLNIAAVVILMRRSLKKKS